LRRARVGLHADTGERQPQLWSDQIANRYYRFQPTKVIHSVKSSGRSHPIGEINQSRKPSWILSALDIAEIQKVR
jgi:hypothetical protein